MALTLGYKESIFFRKAEILVMVKTSSAIKDKSRGVNRPVFLAKSINTNALAELWIGKGPNLTMMELISLRSSKAFLTSLGLSNIFSSSI